MRKEDRKTGRQEDRKTGRQEGKEGKEGWMEAKKQAKKQEKKPEKEAGEIADLDSSIIENYEKVTPILIIS